MRTKSVALGSDDAMSGRFWENGMPQRAGIDGMMIADEAPTLAIILVISKSSAIIERCVFYSDPDL